MQPPLKIHITSQSSVHHAREMRRNSTDVERRLWSYLRGRRMGNCKFRRQHPIGPFIVDFCCVERKLVIELDESQHEEERGYDARRSHFLKERGYRVLRFWNGEALTATESVLERIALELGR
jgi:very-short-patch-repair endonuclease